MFDGEPELVRKLELLLQLDEIGCVGMHDGAQELVGKLELIWQREPVRKLELIWQLDGPGEIPSGGRELVLRILGNIPLQT